MLLISFQDTEFKNNVDTEKHILHSTVQIINGHAYDTIKGLSAIQHN